MPTSLRVRSLTADEQRVIAKLARSQTASARLVQRATILQLGSQGQTVPQIAGKLGLDENTVRKWCKRFNDQGLAGVEDAPRPGAPSRYTGENKARVVAVALTPPQALGLPYGSWTFERLAVYVRDQLGLQLKKTRIFEILRDEGLRWAPRRKQERWFGERLDPEFAQKRGRSRP
jgi:transposase